MRNRRVHPQVAGADPERGSDAFFTDVKDAWSAAHSTPERAPGERSVSNASGGSLVPMLPIDAMKSDESLQLPLKREASQESEGRSDPSSGRSSGVGSTPRLSKHIEEEDHRAPSCSSYYAPRNRCEHS